MADYLPGEIHIGGPIPRSLLPALCEAIADENGGLEWGSYGYAPTPDDIVALEGQKISMVDDQATNAIFEDLEDFLAEHEIEYDRMSDAKYEVDGEVERGRKTKDGYKVFDHLGDQTGGVLVRAKTLIDILDGADKAESPVALAELIRSELELSIPDLAPLSIVEDEDD